ncbi:hypothetical protein ACMU_15200 [Actibacterium mucosum KCTC 23349]|uniref:histidine kinase n=2 Tax=Actibacterium TaxID=1433986 RepID=A0A037ZF46_9RHOB|nr:hypothetical protein ACMU_15200 [Actibacterium mucosum KCTC 23349]
MARFGYFILAAIGILFFALLVFGSSLARDLRGLARTDTDNIQWTLSQVETELARLGAAVAVARTDPQSQLNTVRFRSDIMLSRLSLLDTGKIGELFAGNAKADDLRGKIQLFGDQLIDVLDQPGALNHAVLPQMAAMVDETAPHVRQLALLGVSVQASQSEQTRAEFSATLLRTGGAAVALLVALVGVLIWLNQSLQHVRRSDSALRLTTRRLSATVAASLDAIVTVDKTGVIRGFNTAAEEIFGWSRNEVIDKPMADVLIPMQYREAHEHGMERFLATGKPVVVDSGRIELSALRKSGEEFPVEINITSARAGGETMLIAYMRDISQRIINEQGLIDARDRAQQADKAKSQFLAVMSHEMRTPLNGILGVLDLLKTTPLSPQQSRYAQIATASGEILLEHVNEALDITRIESGALAMSPSTFQLSSLVHEVVDVLEPLAQEKGLRLSLEIDPAMNRPFRADANRLRQILTNLVGNAIKFTDTGAIGVMVTGVNGPQTTALKIEVQDTGPGISPEDHDLIFQDFTSLADGAGRQTRSDGLGLSISRRIARLMDGDLAVDSTPGQGSVFTLSLPLQRVATAPTEPKSTDEATTPDTASQDILIVEDNAVNRSVLRDMLSQLGHNVFEATNGQEGIESCAARPFALVLMDISMPVLGGIEATQQIRKGTGPNAETPIFGLTAHGSEEYRDRALHAGMTQLFTKPIRLPVLRGILDQSSPAATDNRAKPQGGVDFTVLAELKQVLGHEKLTRTAADFFAETAQSLATLPAVDPSETRERLHKIRGAAALLGLTGVLTHLDILSAATKADDKDATANAKSALTAALQDAKAALAALP